MLTAIPFREANATDPLGMYVGGAVGQSRVEADVSGIFGSGIFREDHGAFQVMAGVRPISLLGAELAYVNLGHPSGDIGGFPADVTTRGVAAFGVLYLPIPIPAFDIYAKAGLARMQGTVNSTNYRLRIDCFPGLACTPMYTGPNFPMDRTDTHFAAGAGAQVKFGSWAVRAEFERFDAIGAHPSLASVGITWSF
jgi:hypothetical protein